VRNEYALFMGRGRGEIGEGVATTKRVTRKRGGQKPRKNVHAEITASIIESLKEAHGNMWECPWVRAGGLPSNVKSKSTYNGINILQLWDSARKQCFNSQKWGTFNQWKEAGYQVKKGEHGTPVIFYSVFDKAQSKDDSTKAPSSDSVAPEGQAPGDKERTSIPFIRRFAVFNGAQIEGFEDVASAPKSESEQIESAEQCVKDTKAEIEAGLYNAAYNPEQDVIRMPSSFRDTKHSTATENKYSTLFHELGHWTGHPSRLNRKLNPDHASKEYAMEELIAELTSAFLCSEQGISPTPREDHAPYLASWLKLLEEDDKAIFTAAAKASQSVAYINSLGLPSKGQAASNAPAPALDV